MANMKEETRLPQIGEDQYKFLELLSNACAVSGDEGEVRKIVLEELRPYADELRVDALGNVLVTRRSTGERPVRVMLAAHMDEVGFMLTHDAEIIPEEVHQGLAAGLPLDGLLVELHI